jgi:hypothetical protein
MAKWDDEKKKVPIRYTARDFGSIRAELVDYAKRYYPDTFKDFSDASFGAMMVDMVAYVGDVLSFYLDYSVNESFLDTALEYNNVVKLSRQLGYKFRGKPSTYGIITLYCLCPANVTGLGPDTAYLPIALKGSQFVATTGDGFILTEDVDFAKSTNEIVVGRVDEFGAPTHYVIRAKGSIVSGRITSQVIPVDGFQKFRKIELIGTNIAEIMRVRDSEGHDYYEVDYLSQDAVYKEVPNLGAFRNNVTAVLKPFAVPRRYVVEKDVGRTSIVFGYGSDSELKAGSVTGDLIEPSNVVLNQHARNYITDVGFDPTNLIKSDKFGVGPSNTSLTVQYRINSNSNSNAGPGSVGMITNMRVKFANRFTLDEVKTKAVQGSIECNNEERIVGDVTLPTADELRRLTIDNYATQNRAVTKKDYQALIYSMHPKYGAITRCNVIQDKDSFKRNLNIYIISEDENKKLVPSNNALKNNLKVWLNDNRMINDTIDILDAKVVNFGIDYSIVTEAGKNKYDVLQRCSRVLRKRYRRKYDIGEPLEITEIYRILGRLDGVADVVDVNILKKVGDKYSDIRFDFVSQTTPDGRFVAAPENVILECKYLYEDIKGVTV